jgi:hypothetical protein
MSKKDGSDHVNLQILYPLLIELSDYQSLKFHFAKKPKLTSHSTMLGSFEVAIVQSKESYLNRLDYFLIEVENFVMALESKWQS